MIQFNRQSCQVPFSGLENKYGTLHILEKVILPPTCETLVECIIANAKCRVIDKRTVYVNSRASVFEKHGIMVAKGIGIIKNNKILIAISNLATKEIELAKGTILANYEEINERDWDTIELDEKERGEIENVNAILIDLDTPGYEDLPKDLNIGSVGTKLTDNNLKKLLQLIRKHKFLFAQDADNPGQVKRIIAEHSIDVQGAIPISEGPRRTSPNNRKIMRDAVKKMIESGIIEPSRSPWAAPVVLVPKKTGEVRFAIDYRKLNAVTKKEIYPLPRIDDTLDALGDAKFFSTFDMAAGYWQIPMSINDREKTAFVTHEGQYQYNVMPFGLCNAPATFQRLMDTVLAGLKWQSCLVYLDDVIVFSNDFDKHLLDLHAVLTRLREAGLKLKAKKWHFCCEEVDFLGHVISNKGIKANPKKLEVIKNWPVPETVKQIQSFLGLTGYYRRLVKDYALLELPLRNLTRNDVEFIMGEKELLSFNKLKEKLISDPILGLPNFSGEYPFEVHVDASDLGLGAVLCQKIDNMERVIQYISRTLTKDELKWHTKEKEALGIVWSLLQFKPYLLGQPFVVRTDHESLKWLHKADKGRLARWALALSEFQFKIEPRKGTQNANADALSRNTVHADIPNEEMDELPYIYVCNISSVEKRTIVDLYRQLVDAQKSDKCFRACFDKLTKQLHEKARLELDKKYTSSKPTEQIDLILDNGLICRQFNKRLQVLVPRVESVVHSLLYHHHDAPLAGHLGRTRTYNKIRQAYYWPGMPQDVKRYVAGCLKCQTHKASKPNDKQFLLYPSVFKQPNARIGIDLIGPLPLTERYNQYILTAIDYFTKMAMAIPIRDKTAMSVAEALYNGWYCSNGIPYEIQSDQGGEFTGDVVRRLNDRLETDHRVTTPYNPAANGEVERLNRTLKNSLRIYAEEFIGTWDKHLPSICFAYNTSRHEVTGYSPFYLWHGREARLPTDVFEGGFQEISHDIDQYQLLMTQHLKRAYEIVKKQLEENALDVKNKWEQKIRKLPKKFRIGDKVLFYNPQLNADPGEDRNHVFKRKWKGPLLITGNPYPAIYIVRDPVTLREFSVNMNKLREYEKYNFIKTNVTQVSMDKSIEATIIADSNHLNTQKQDAVDRGKEKDDVNASNEKLSEIHNLPGGKHRLVDGKTRQENERERKRERKHEAIKSNFIERALSHIVSHRRGKYNQIEYLIRWENATPNEDECRLEKEYNRKVFEYIR